jgi:DNA-binding GntR family transcriptional regulator
VPQIVDEDFRDGHPASDGARTALAERPSLTELVTERLIADIASGAVRPGERLVETQIAASLGISRAPLREALQQLEAQGLVESRKGRGTFVRDVDIADVEQMLSVRAMLEGLAARLAAVHGTDRQHTDLEVLHRRFEAAARAGRLGEWRQLDWEFHEAVCQASGNSVLLTSWRAVSTLVRVFLHKHQGFEADMAGILDSHSRLLAVIRSRDGDRAEALFRSRILSTGYAQLGRPMPKALEVYVTEGDDQTVVVPKQPSR